MMQQVQVQKRSVKRMDECAREWETTQHEETLSEARRASRRASQTIARAQYLVALINEVI